MSQTTPQVADTETSEEGQDAPRVRVLITMVEDADMDAALAVVRRQAYEPAPAITVVGASDGGEGGGSLEEEIAATEASFDYLWILHADARPRPDALSALVAEMERSDAALAGSKLLKAGSMDELESVGGATDVFGEPYSGIDEGEIDLQQYDVVREVAFVQSVSMLVRRDLAQGLRGLDPLLPPVAAGLDFSQRARLAGGRVITVPSSEVYHQDRCRAPGDDWHERAGRLRAMMIAYSPLTLLWVVPYDLGVSVLDSLANLLFLRWRATMGHLYAWLWNAFHLPSTVGQRRRLRSVRSEGDVELFRFQTGGSVRLRVVGEEMSGKILSVFDDDQALARGTKRVWASPGIWGAILALVVILVGARSLILSGVPNTGFSFPFEPPTTALRRWFSGLSDSGLGSGSAVHPSVLLTGLSSLLWFGAEGAARTLATIGAAVMGVVGIGRLCGRVGIRGPGRYLAGVVLIGGPGVALVVGAGSWLALVAAAALPWAVRATFVHPRDAAKSRMSRYGWAVLLSAVVALLSPALVAVPILVVVLWRVFGGDRSRVLVALATVLGAVGGIAWALGDPGWFTDGSRRLALAPSQLWPILILVAAAPALTAASQIRALALTGGSLSLGALVVLRSVELGPGLEEALLVTASFGAALVVAASLNALSRNILQVAAALGAFALVAMSLPGVANGRLGLPTGDINNRLSFVVTLAGDAGPGRILHISADRSLIPGEVRSGPGFWYRVLDGSGTTEDEVWLPSPLEGDEALAGALEDIASGADLRPGERLAEFAVGWVVLEGPETPLDDALVAQLDLEPLPLDPEARVYQNESAVPLAGTPETPWSRSGIGYAGDVTESSVPIAVNFDDGWSPDATRISWFVQVDGGDGVATYVPSDTDRMLSIASIVTMAAALMLIVVGRARS
ncbi:MAG: glycosyltransferase [Acidimicrobiia bacterium]|jgi:GT2 family glycosyltransferase